MQILLSRCGLHSSQDNYEWETGSYQHHKIVPGITVCRTNNSKILGKVIDILKEELGHDGNTYYVTEVQVLWLTGAKKGTREKKSTRSLINYDLYKKRVIEELNALEKAEAEAKINGDVPRTVLEQVANL